MNILVEWAVTSSVLILIVLAARRLFRDKLSARLRYALWAVVLARLLVPFQAELPAKVSGSVPPLASNLAPDVDQWMDSTAIYADPVAFYPVGWKPGDEGASGRMPDAGLSQEYVPALIVIGGEGTTYYGFALSKGEVLFLIWAVGAGIAALIILVSNLRFYGGLRKRRKRLEDAESPIPVYGLEGLPSPCLFGVFWPAVYVTPGAAENPDALRHVLAHELTHYKHKDHIWSSLRCLALALHWYNPLVWLAAVLSKGDGELACDEGAVARLGEAERIPYGRTLVDMVAQRSARPVDLLSCSTAMTGGKKSIQQRVARLVKKPKTVKAALFAAAALVAVAVVFVFARRGQPDNTPAMLFDYLSRTTEIRYSPPVYSSTIYPYPLTNEDLLAEAKEALSTFVLLDDGDPQPDLTPRGVLQEHRVTLTFEGGQMEYSLLRQNDRTYLFPGSILRQSLDLKREKGENAQLLGVSGTCVSEVDVIGALADLARHQTGLNRDPNLPVSMTQDELKQYDAAFLRKIGVTQLQGRPDSMESVTFHAGYTSPDSIQLWYWGDEAHNGVWVLALSKDGYTLLADQPIEVFNAAQNAAEEKSYEQLGPGAFAACLRPADVTSSRLSRGDETMIGVLTGQKLQTLKDQMVQALYHQVSVEYDGEKYGQYSLTIYVEKDVDYYLHDGGEDGLTLSIGSEPDVVCMRHRILASPDGPMSQYVRSPELYRTIAETVKGLTQTGPDYLSFLAQVERASSIRLILPAHSSQSSPVPITDGELLVLVKERLDNFVPLNPDNVLTSWNEKLPSASQIVLSDGETEAAYALLPGADNRTYLFSGNDYNACLASGGGETVQIKPIARTKIETNIEGSLSGYARSQEERNRDPNFFVLMPYAEYQAYTPEFLREKGITRLQGWGGRIEDVKLSPSGYKARDCLQLRYYGDETHYGLWALVVDRETWAVLADQPIVVFNAEQAAGADPYPSYKLLDPAASAAFLRPEDVLSVTAGSYAPGQAIDLDIPALKEQLTQSLYHQLDASYDEAQHGQYVLKLQLIDSGEDTYLGHELAEDANRLTLSIGRETDVVCLRKTELSINSEYPHCAFVRSPELYRAIRSLFD